MQEVSFIPSLGMTPAEFWAEVKQNARESNMDEILAYMNLMIGRAVQKKQPMTLLALTRHGKKVRMFKGSPVLTSMLLHSVYRSSIM